MMIASAGICHAAFAQTSQTGTSRATLAGEVAHAQRMRMLFPDAARGGQAVPPVIPKLEIDPDRSGAIATVQPNGPTVTAGNAFFGVLGTNGRSCFTCHQPQDGWSLSAKDARARFAVDPDAPLFRLVDGATCASDDVSTPEAKRKAYGLLLQKGLIRIALPMPSQALQFEIIGVDDPYDCNTSPTTGLTSPGSGIVSVYRRPLPATNLGFLSTIMWDGREPDLFSQAADATLGHAQATAPPSLAQQRQIVAFEGCTQAATPAACANIPPQSGVFSAQIFDDQALDLDDGADGGPVSLPQQLTQYFIGVNDPLGNNPRSIPFTPKIFSLYDQWNGAWAGPRQSFSKAAARAAIARGEQVFNTVKINITGVGGLNDALGKPSIPGFCSTCHDTPAIGDHSVKAPLNIGVADAGANSPPGLDIAGLPVFTIWCKAGPLAGQILTVTDPGRALITGQCADIGKLKGPILRGLAARAPYFHNGSAASLRVVVEFYDRRFTIGLTDQQKADLVAFLNAL
ncbi:MAG TPA: hypothetical protein VGM07_05900 [Stellaceae bacterium]|jgi:hypothetical protein